jgi:hypothetical protein
MTGGGEATAFVDAALAGAGAGALPDFGVFATGLGA